jgi:hypothetical protein
VRSRFVTLLVLAAWLLASGAHWDFLQSFAWGKMIATYSQTMPLREAVRLTFTADNLCGVCEWVADGKTRDADEDAANPFAAQAKAKALLVMPPDFSVAVLPSSRGERSWPRVELAGWERGRDEPALGPPRVG